MVRPASVAPRSDLLDLTGRDGRTNGVTINLTQLDAVPRPDGYWLVSQYNPQGEPADARYLDATYQLFLARAATEDELVEGVDRLAAALPPR